MQIFDETRFSQAEAEASGIYTRPGFGAQRGAPVGPMKVECEVLESIPHVWRAITLSRSGFFNLDPESIHQVQRDPKTFFVRRFGFLHSGYMVQVPNPITGEDTIAGYTHGGQNFPLDPRFAGLFTELPRRAAYQLRHLT